MIFVQNVACKPSCPFSGKWTKILLLIQHISTAKVSLYLNLNQVNFKYPRLSRSQSYFHCTPTSRKVNLTEEVKYNKCCRYFLRTFLLVWWPQILMSFRIPQSHKRVAFSTLKGSWTAFLFYFMRCTLLVWFLYQILSFRNKRPFYTLI